MMSPAYVEAPDFRVVNDRWVGCCGRKLRIRTYRLKINPSTEPANDISHTVVAHWERSGRPRDAVFHLGSFYRVTTE